VRLTHQDIIAALAYSPSGRYLATGSSDGTSRVWEVSTGMEVARLWQDGYQVTTVAYSPDGKYLATGGTDNTARIWEWSTKREVARVTHSDIVLSVAFSPDGHYLATSSSDKTTQVHLWRPSDMIHKACARLARNLSSVEWNEYLPGEPYRKTCPDLP
jgi:WD40 repeat protein